jgi:hypothetical protein
MILTHAKEFRGKIALNCKTLGKYRGLPKYKMTTIGTDVWHKIIHKKYG